MARVTVDAPAPLGNASRWEALEWESFIAEFDKMWKPGQHIALVGPTGVGKTTFAVHLLKLRNYVLALDPKGGDTTLGGLTKHGFVKVSQWPLPKKIEREIREGKPAKLIVTRAWRTAEDEPKLVALLERAIDGAFEMGGWTLYIDELQLAADRRMGKLSAGIERCLIAARDRGVSVVTSFQRPANVPRTASDQSTYLAVWYTRDRDVVHRLSEMMGRERAEVRGAVNALDPHCILVASNNPHDPVLATYVPKA